MFTIPCILALCFLVNTNCVDQQYASLPYFFAKYAPMLPMPLANKNKIVHAFYFRKIVTPVWLQNLIQKNNECKKKKFNPEIVLGACNMSPQDIAILQNEDNRLHRAAALGDLDDVMTFTRQYKREGDDIDRPTLENGSTALMYAAEQGHEEVVNYLLKQKADVKVANFRGMTALHYAVKKNLNVVEKLVQAGAALNAQNADGNTSLMLARSAAYMDYLIQNGANVCLTK